MLVAKPDVVLISTSSPLTAREVQELGLAPGEVRKQENELGRDT